MQLGRIVYVHLEAINLYKNNLIVGIETNEKLMTTFYFAERKFYEAVSYVHYLHIVFILTTVIIKSYLFSAFFKIYYFLKKYLILS